MGEWWRKIPHHTYGRAGGARKDVAIRREELDPLDQLFYDHDWGLDGAESAEERLMVDQQLHEALKDFDEYAEIPWYRRWYAKMYVWSVVKMGIFNREKEDG